MIDFDPRKLPPVSSPSFVNAATIPSMVVCEDIRGVVAGQVAILFRQSTRQVVYYVTKHTSAEAEQFIRNLALRMAKTSGGVC